MGIIKKLSAEQAQKIAAGEVVERPSNVVKELVENSLDAGATQISLYIEDAGKQLIRIVDNGCGMSREDAYLCIEHHATSKLETVDQLATIATFGFRGEALSSISSVAKTTIITKQENAENGIKLEIENGVVLNESIVAAPTGTDIAIHDLFYNIPARKKFLKKRETEWQQILTLFHALCFAHLNVHFKLFHDGKMVFNCPAVPELTTRYAQLYDHSVAQHIIPADDQSMPGIAISGAISNHHHFRYDRSHVFFFVNQRWVKNYTLAKSLMKGFANVLPPERYPVGAVFITVDTHEVDINIHPRKEEVQFLHPRRIETHLQYTIKKSLEAHLAQSIKPQQSDVLPMGPIFVVPRFEEKRSSNFQPQDMSYSSFLQTAPQKSYTPYREQAPIAPQVSQETPAEFIPRESAQHDIQMHVAPAHYESYRIIGNYNKTYILIEKEDGLFLLDQHAAHERVLYEQFRKRFHDIATIQLMFPEIISLTAQELEIIEEHLDLFQAHGIIAEIFGKTQLRIQATPVHLKNQSISELVRMIIGWIVDYKTLDKAEFSKTVNEKIHAQMACKAAVKAGDILTESQMKELIDDLAITENRFSCPHGRPTGWLLSEHDIEKKFKRKA